uniref:Uncharacterized protein n=1 Tax=Lactuca sativa TaxID=4236 RepID=A0A9R1XF62_LACSA|nr:hypothetical protein LSAT_V11C500236260 [Lactuca sativa]
MRVQPLTCPPRSSHVLEEPLPTPMSPEYNMIKILNKDKGMSSYSKILSLDYDVNEIERKSLYQVTILRQLMNLILVCTKNNYNQILKMIKLKWKHTLKLKWKHIFKLKWKNMIMQKLVKMEIMLTWNITWLMAWMM